MPTIAFGTGSKWKGQVRVQCTSSLAVRLNMPYRTAQDVTDYVLQAMETGFSHIDSAQCMFVGLSPVCDANYQ